MQYVFCEILGGNRRNYMISNMKQRLVKQSSYQRVQYIDVAKGIGILLVVLFHVELLENVTGKFHMPLFAYLSGLLFQSKYYMDVKSVFLWVQKKVKGIYIPFIKYNLIFLVLHNFFLRVSILSDATNVEYFSPKDIALQGVKILLLGGGESLVGPLWYLIAMLEFATLYCVIRYVCSRIFVNEKAQSLSVTVACVLAMIIGFSPIALPRNLNRALVLMMYYHLGFKLKSIQIEENEKKRPYILLIDTISILGLLLGVHYTEGWATFHMLIIPASLGGIQLVVHLARIIAKKDTSIIFTYLSYVGKHSLEILALHLLAYKIVMKIQIMFYDLEPQLLGSFPIIQNTDVLWKIAIAFIGINVPLLYVMMRDKVLKKIKHH